MVVAIEMVNKGPRLECGFVNFITPFQSIKASLPSHDSSARQFPPPLQQSKSQIAQHCPCAYSLSRGRCDTKVLKACVDEAELRGRKHQEEDGFRVVRNKGSNFMEEGRVQEAQILSVFTIPKIRL